MDSQVAVALALSLVGGVSTSIGTFLCSFTYFHHSYCVMHCQFRPIGESVKSLGLPIVVSVAYLLCYCRKRLADCFSHFQNANCFFNWLFICLFMLVPAFDKNLSSVVCYLFVFWIWSVFSLSFFVRNCNKLLFVVKQVRFLWLSIKLPIWRCSGYYRWF